MNRQVILMVLAMIALVALGLPAGHAQSLRAATEAATAAGTAAPDGTAQRPLINPCTGQPFTTVATGRALQTADAAIDSSGTQYVVNFTLADNEEAQRFATYTATHMHDQLAIALDGRVIAAPVVQTALTTAGVIQGNFTHENAQKLALQLRSGALPVALVIESSTKEKDGTSIVLVAAPGVVANAETLDSARQIIEKRLADLNAAQATVTLSGDKIVVVVPAPLSFTSFVDAIVQPGLLEFVDFSKVGTCNADMPTVGQYVLTDVQISRVQPAQPTAAATTSAK